MSLNKMGFKLEWNEIECIARDHPRLIIQPKNDQRIALSTSGISYHQVVYVLPKLAGVASERGVEAKNF